MEGLGPPCPPFTNLVLFWNCIRIRRAQKKPRYGGAFFWRLRREITRHAGMFFGFAGERISPALRTGKGIGFVQAGACSSRLSGCRGARQVASNPRKTSCSPTPDEKVRARSRVSNARRACVRSPLSSSSGSRRRSRTRLASFDDHIFIESADGRGRRHLELDRRGVRRGECWRLRHECEWQPEQRQRQRREHLCGEQPAGAGADVHDRRQRERLRRDKHHRADDRLHEQHGQQWQLHAWNLNFTNGPIIVSLGKVSGTTFTTKSMQCFVSGGTGTPGSGSSANGAGTYLTFTLPFPVHLDPNTTYGFDFIIGNGCSNFSNGWARTRRACSRAARPTRARGARSRL